MCLLHFLITLNKVFHHNALSLHRKGKEMDRIFNANNETTKLNHNADLYVVTIPGREKWALRSNFNVGGWDMDVDLGTTWACSFGCQPNMLIWVRPRRGTGKARPIWLERWTFFGAPAHSACGRASLRLYKKQLNQRNIYKLAWTLIHARLELPNGINLRAGANWESVCNC